MNTKETYEFLKNLCEQGPITISPDHSYFPNYVKSLKLEKFDLVKIERPTMTVYNPDDSDPYDWSVSPTKKGYIICERGLKALKRCFEGKKRFVWKIFFGNILSFLKKFKKQIIIWVPVTAGLVAIFIYLDKILALFGG